MVTKTFLLLRCTTLKYAKAFLNTGNIYFGRPKNWINDAKINGEGRGDSLEGTFASCHESNTDFINYISSNYPGASYKVISNKCYFHRNQVLNLPTFCLFGVNDNLFNSSAWNAQHKKLPLGTIKLDYFNDFYSGISEKEYDSLPDDKKPVVIMIKNPHLFFERIRKFFINLGVDSNSIIISPIKYINMTSNFIIHGNPPAELFFKSERFSNQSEIRIVINTTDKDIVNKIDKCNGIFNIGNMSDISEIYDYYFHDLPMQIDGDSMYFVLPKPITTKISSSDECIGYIMCALCDEIPQCNTPEETKHFISEMCDLLEREYSFICDREKYTFTNTITGQTFSPDWKHINSVLISHAYAHYSEGDYTKALDLYNRAIEYVPDSAQNWFDRGCCQCQLQKHQAAIDDIQKAITLDPDNDNFKKQLDSYFSYLSKNKNIPEDTQLYMY